MQNNPNNSSCFFDPIGFLWACTSPVTTQKGQCSCRDSTVSTYNPSVVKYAIYFWGQLSIRSGPTSWWFFMKLGELKRNCVLNVHTGTPTMQSDVMFLCSLEGSRDSKVIVSPSSEREISGSSWWNHLCLGEPSGFFKNWLFAKDMVTL